jgi:hypothetical protein
VKLGLLLAAGVLLGLLSPAQCAGQMVQVVTKVDTVVVIPAGYLGLTQCDDAGNAVSFVKAGMDSVLTAEVTAHEAKHREQARRYPSCQAYQAAYRGSLRLQVETEAEAYCEGFKVRITPEWTWSHAQALLLIHLNRLYLGVPLGTLAETVRRWCHD